jgi:GDPmannose 4,6-dehydratase
VAAAVRIRQGSKEKLELGRIDIQRDWGWAPEYVEAMWLMLQQDEPDDYVIATGTTTSLEEYTRRVFAQVGLDWVKFVTLNPELHRPADIQISFGLAAKAEKTLKWKARVQLPEIIERMVEAEEENFRLGSPRAAKGML